MMKIFIVGGLGYIGGRLARALSNHKDVTVYLTTRRDEANIPAWAEAFNVLMMDLLDEESVSRCLKEARPDIVIHLGSVDYVACLHNPKEANEVNIEGTSRLLDQAYRNGVRKFIYFSSFHVYGDLRGDVTESNPLLPSHAYGETKRSAEDHIKQFHIDKKMQVLILRLSNGYGYAMDRGVAGHVWTLVFNAFCKQAMEERRITIRSDQYRNFITLYDITCAVQHFLFSIPKEWQDGVFNLGGEECLLVSEVAEKISKLYEKHYKNGPLKINGPAEDANRVFEPFYYNIDKLKKTGFTLSGDMGEEVLGTMQLCETMIKENR